jgi:hypothetical protein
MAEGGRVRIDSITKELWLCQPVRLEESPVWGTVYYVAEAVKKGKITSEKRGMHDTPHHLLDPPVCGILCCIPTADLCF